MDARTALPSSNDDTEESPAADLELEFRRPATREVFHMTLLLEAGTNPPVYRRTWNDVTTKMGRWDIKVKNGNSNTLNFKIGKRKQIVQLARYWTGLGLSRDDVACSCDSFTNGIYAQVGLIPQNAAGGADRSNYGLLALDSGDGALIFFWYRSNKTDTDDGTPSHIGILAGGDRIDCNGARTFSESGAGPTSNPRDRWCSNYRIAIGDWFWGGTLPTRTVVDPAGGSLLEALDAE